MDIFAKIAAGEIPSYKCAENEEFYAFLDINPLGVLCFPRYQSVGEGPYAGHSPS